MPFSVVTYNILADCYIRPEWFPSTPPAVLSPAARRPALLRRLENLAADVLCLQEVEPARFDELHAGLHPAGYSGHYARKGAGRPDGCATFVREGVAVRSVRTLHFADGGGAKPDSGHIALVTVLEIAGRTLGVANTHLRWHPPETPASDRLGEIQMRQLLGEIASDSGATNWIVCGDFNATGDSGTADTLRQVGFADAFHLRPNANTCNSNRCVKRIDFLFHTAGLSAQPADLPAIDDHTPLPSAAEPSDHLPVAAVFEWQA